MVLASVEDLVEHERFLQEGNMPRCPHGMYLAGGRKKAPYCTGCHPSGPPFPTRNVHMPDDSSTPLVAPELRANKKAKNECPECHSRIYIEAKNASRECAECGSKYPAPRKRIR
jgi:hypothetical protein